jgi:hypothetical protein
VTPKNAVGIPGASHVVANFEFEDMYGAEVPMSRIEPGMLAPLEVNAAIEVDGFPDTAFEVQLRFRPETRSYVMEKLSIANVKGITVSEMHSYSIPSLITQSAASAIFVELLEVTGEEGKFALVRDVLTEIDLETKRAEMKESGPTRASLWWVALVYAYWRAIGRSNANDQVVAMFDLPKRTATRWIARARSEGLLDG